MSWMGRAVAIAGEYEMAVGAQILAHLARLLQEMGEDEFTAAWKEPFGPQEPLLKTVLALIKDILRRQDEGAV